MKPSLEEKSVAFHFELTDPNFVFEIDSYLIEQVLINLILNAIDATENVPEAKIMIYAGLNHKGIEQIWISDTGRGIPSEIVDSIFVPFFQHHKTRQQQRPESFETDHNTARG